MRTIGEKLDQKLAQDTREHCDMPEDARCDKCGGKGKIYFDLGEFEEQLWEYCERCNGTGIKPDGFTDRVDNLIKDMKEAGK